MQNNCDKTTCAVTARHVTNVTVVLHGMSHYIHYTTCQSIQLVNHLDHVTVADQTGIRWRQKQWHVCKQPWHAALSVKAKFHYASVFGAGSELVRSWLRTCSEPARGVMEFGFNWLLTVFLTVMLLRLFQHQLTVSKPTVESVAAVSQCTISTKTYCCHNGSHVMGPHTALYGTDDILYKFLNYDCIISEHTSNFKVMFIYLDLKCLKPNSITLAGSKQIRSWSHTCSELKFGLSSSLLAAN